MCLHRPEDSPDLTGVGLILGDTSHDTRIDPYFKILSNREALSLFKR